MIVFNQQCLADYAADDVVRRMIKETTQPGDDLFASHRWLVESQSKRMIFHALYGDVLAPNPNCRRLLDVGGGFSALTRLLVRDRDYRVVELMAHDAPDRLEHAQAEFGNDCYTSCDWYDYEVAETYDLIIANDLFPNVDQRLEIFLETFLPVCTELRMSLTYYNESRWYRVRRTDAAEVFHVVAWDGAQLMRVLEKYVDRIETPCLSQLLENPPSLFANGRHVADVRFRGGKQSR